MEEGGSHPLLSIVLRIYGIARLQPQWNERRSWCVLDDILHGSDLESS
jgi:hypothetical protein